VELIARLGFDGYDLSLAGNRSRVSLADVLADVAGWAGRLEERVCGRGLSFSDVFHIPANDFETMAPNHPEMSERDRGRAQFEEILELADRLRAPGMTVLPGLDWPHESHDESLARAAEELGRRAAQARERGVRLSFEPHVGSVCHGPADIAQLCELAPGLELTLDYTHYVVQGYGAAELEPLLAHARHVHMRGGDRDRLQAPLRDSAVDYERIVDVLLESGYDGYMAVEYCWVEWSRLNEVDVISETVMLRDRLRAKLAGEPWVYRSPDVVDSR
jgi:sugar phosphate isomerase/epimerase